MTKKYYILTSIFYLLIFLMLPQLGFAIEARLQIPVPGFQPSETLAKPDPETGIITTDLLPEYIAAVYSYLVGFASLFAMAIIMYGGMKWIFAGGDSGKITKAKEVIQHAMIGLVLALGSYLILFTLNPKLTTFEALRIRSIKANPLVVTTEAEDEDETDESAAPAITPNFVTVQTEFMVRKMTVNQTVAETVQNVARELSQATEDMPGGPFKLAGGGYRPLDGADWSQVAKWARNCEGKDRCSPLAVCNPFPPNQLDGSHRRLPGAIPDARRCPHTSGVALDYGCNDVNTESFYAPCQRKLEEIMLRKGFCRLPHEPWHFENPKLTRSCTNVTGRAEIRVKDPSTGEQVKTTRDYSSCNETYNLRTGTCS